MKKNIKKNTKNEDKNSKVVEHFGIILPTEDGEYGMKGATATSFTKSAFCLGLGSSGGTAGTAIKKRGISLVPNKDQMSGEFSKFNPIWVTFPVLNLIVEILKMVFGVWMWVFKLVFFKTYEIMIPDDLDYGFKAGKKYCFNLMTFRMLITFLCPPAGVFMAYGLTGFVQIIICMVLSLLFYVPGLIYAILVILRSDVAEYMEQVELDVCADDGSTSLFFSGDDDNKPKCAAKVGDTCTVKGEPRGGDAMNLNCCMQPKFRDGKWYWGDSNDVATGPDGTEISSFAEGELKCKDDFHTKLSEKNICVYKSTGGVGMAGF